MGIWEWLVECSSRRLCCSRKCECLRAGYYDCISLPEISSSVLLSFQIQYRIKRPKTTSETLGRHRLSGCIWNHGPLMRPHISLCSSQLEKWAQFTLITSLKGIWLPVDAVPSELRGFDRSFGHHVHAATVCTAPKYVFFKYLYLNNYEGYLYRILNMAY